MKSADIHVRLSADLKGRILHRLKLQEQADPDQDNTISGVVVALLKEWLKSDKKPLQDSLD